jgi:hypothetical protein
MRVFLTTAGGESVATVSYHANVTLQSKARASNQSDGRHKPMIVASTGR